MILCDKSIIEYNRQGLLIDGLLTPEQIDYQVRPNSFDLTLGGTWKKLRPNSYMNDEEHASIQFNDIFDKFICSSRLLGMFIDLDKPILYDEGEFEDFYILQPNEFILMASNEVLNIPAGIVAFVQGRSSIARVAIKTEDAGLIDAGFRGTVTFEIQNDSPYYIKIYKDMKIAHVHFEQAEVADKMYGDIKASKYQGQIEATSSKIHMESLKKADL